MNTKQTTKDGVYSALAAMLAEDALKTRDAAETAANAEVNTNENEQKEPINESTTT